MAESESGADKTEDPTEKRKKDSREKGEIARSKELNTLAIMLAGSAGLLIFGGALAQDMMELMRYNFSLSRDVLLNPDSMGAFLLHSGKIALIALQPVLLTLLIAALVGPISLGGWLFAAGSLLARWFIPRLGRLNADLPDLRLHLSAGEGDLDPRRPGLDALLVFAEPPWPADMQVYELASERIGPVLSPRFAGFEQLRQAPASDLLEQPLLHTTSRPQAWPSWARQHGLEPGALKLGQGFEHLYYLLEAAVAGLGVAIAPEPLVAEDLRAGRLVAPWGFSETPAHLALWLPKRAADGRAGQLAQWLKAELLRQPM